MSERGGGGGTPGNPPRIPGIPSNASFHEIAEFRTLNAQRPRPSIQDQEMAWCQNLMPIGAYYLRSLPDKSSLIYGSPPPEFMSFAVALGTGTAHPIVLDAVSKGVLIVPSTCTIESHGPPLIVSNTGTCEPMTTLYPDEIIVIWISANGPATGGHAISPPNVQSITGAGLVFQRRFKTSAEIASSYNAYATQIFADVEEWWAIAPTPLANATFTVTFDNVVESAVFGAISVAFANIGDPWDTTTVSAINVNNNSGPNSALQVGPLSTTVNNDIIFSFFVTYNNSPWGYVYPGVWGTELFVPPSSEDWVDAAVMLSGSNLCGDWNLSVGYANTYPSPQAGVVPYALSPGSTGPCWIGAADAIKGYPLPSGLAGVLTNSNLGFPASASTFLFSGWVKVGASGGFNLMSDIVPSSGVQITVEFTTVWTINVQGWDAEGGNAVSGSINAGVNLGIGWHSIAISVDTANGTIQWMVDSVLVSTAGLFNGFPIASAPNDTWQIGGNQSAEVDLSQLWFAIGQPFVDLSVEENVDKLFGGTNCVQNWGVRGELITGFSPQVFLFGPAANYANNRGAGSMWAVTGVFGNDGTPPVACG